MRPRKVKRELLRKADKLMDTIRKTPKDTLEYESAVAELVNLYMQYGSLMAASGFKFDKED